MGKHQAAIFQSLMGNYETFKQIQQEFGQGLQFGSAEKENAEYVNSLAGKLNHLKEVWVSILTTTVKSDFTKGMLDGFIALSEGIERVVKSLDKTKLAIPTIIASFVSLKTLFKGMSMVDLDGGGRGRRGVTNLLGGFTNGIKSVPTVVRKVTEDVRLAFMSAGDGVRKYNETLATSNKQLPAIKSGFAQFGNSLKQTTIGSTLLNVGTSLLNGALIGLAVTGISLAIKKWDEYNRRHEIAAEKNKENINTINSEIQSLGQQKEGLSGLAKEYDTLTKKQSKSKEELERYNELKRQIADISPDLVAGFDENNNPILALNGSLDDTIKKLEEAIKSKNQLLKNQQNDLGTNETKNISKDIEKLRSEKSKLETDIHNAESKLNNSFDDKLFSGNSWNDKLNNYKNALNQREEAVAKSNEKILENLEKYNEKEAAIQQKAFNKLSETKNYSKLAEDVKNQMNLFIDDIDWGEFSLSEQNSMVGGLDKLSSYISKNSGKVQEWSKIMKNANTNFQASGDLESYKKELGGLSEELASLTGIDAGVWMKGLTQEFQGLDIASQQLHNFLKSYGSSMAELENGNDIATKLKSQFQDLQSFVNDFTLEGSINIDLLKGINNGSLYTDLPQQIKEVIKGVLGKNNKVTEVEQEVLMKISTTIMEEGKLEDDVANKLNKLFSGKLSEKELEIPIKLANGMEIGTETLRNLNNQFKKDPVEVNFKANSEGVEKVKMDAEEVKKLLAGFKDREEVKALFTSEVVGMDKAELFLNIVKYLPTNTEFTNKFIVDNANALSKMQSYQEVVDWLLKNPSIMQQYNIELDGADEAIEKAKEIDEKTKELEKETTVTVNSGELQGTVDDYKELIKYSTELEKGKYKISFETDTADAIGQIDGVVQKVNDLSDAFKSIPNIKIDIATAQGAKNISGLIAKIKEFNNAAGLVKTVKFNTQTTQASKNVTGLRNNVKSYVDSYCGKSFSTKFNTQTALASQNVTGLRNNVSSYINSYAGKSYTTTFNVVTKYSTSGSPSSSGKKKKEPKVQSVSYQEFTDASAYTTSSAQDVQTDTLNLQSRLRAGVDTHETTNNPPSVFSRATSWTPIDTSKYAVLDSTKFNIELLKELENRIKMVNNSLSTLDEKMEKAIGSEKIKYLQQQNTLLKEQQQLQNELASKMKQQQAWIKNELAYNGFSFTSDGNLKNYEEKLLAMEREAKRLEDKAKTASDKSSNYNGKDEKYKKSLENQSKNAQTQVDKYKEKLSNIKSLLNEYIDIATSGLPDTTKEWESLNNQIKENNNLIEELNRRQRVYTYDNKLKELNREYEILADKIAIVNERMEIYYGQNKLNALKEQINLLEQQREKQEEISRQYNRMMWEYKQDMGKYGFKFDSEHNVSNIDEILNKFENSKDLEKVNKLLEEYFKLQDGMNGTKQDWHELNNEIEKSQEALEQLNREQKLYTHKNKIQEIEHQYDSLSDKLDILDIKIKNAYGKDKLNLMSQQIKLMEEQAKKQQELIKSYSDMAKVYKEDLSFYGFKFTEDGDIENLDEILNKYQDSKYIEKIKKLVEEYITIQRDDLPDATLEWEKLQSQIKDAYKEQLNITKDIEDKITEVYKKQLEERRKLVEDEKNKRIKALNEEKDAYNKLREEADYKRDLDEQKDTVAQLQKELAIAQKGGDTKRVKELVKKLEEEQRKLQDMVQEKLDSDINDMFDEEANRIETEADTAIKDLEEKFSDSNLQQIVKDALTNGVFVDIDGNIKNLEDTLLEFEDKFGDGMTAIGSILKEELIANLEVAKNAMDELIKQQSNLSKFQSNTSKGRSESRNTQSNSINISMPITLSGDVSQASLNMVRREVSEMKDEILNEIVQKIY